MRQFARPFPIDKLSLEARILYTAFLVFLLAGIFSSVWLYADSFGDLSAEGAAVYYLGAEGEAGQESGDGGPALELPGEEVPGAELRMEKAPRQVMETFHFHLFTVPVVLLIVGHLFMLTTLSTALKSWIIGVGSVATLAHLFAPLLVRFGGEGWAWMMPATVAVAALGWLPMLVWPLWEMWTRLPGREVAARGS